MQHIRKVVVILILILIRQGLFGQTVNINMTVDTSAMIMWVYSKTPYDSVLHEVALERQAYQKAYLEVADDSMKSDSILRSAGKYLSGQLHRIFPYWFGTKWDFNGYTNTPQRGTVACGYFVSTTLKHLGLNVNRYHLAQQNPLNEAKTIACGSEVNSFGHLRPELLRDSAFADEGLYFVGLDNHVGYVLNHKGVLVFIHSNYIGAEGVVNESIYESLAFQSSVYYVVSISDNLSFIRHWLMNTSVQVVKQ